MQLVNNGTSTRLNFRERHVNPNPKSVSCYKLPSWLVKSLEALLHTLPGVTAIRLTIMAGDNEIGQLNYDLTAHLSAQENLVYLENGTKANGE